MALIGSGLVVPAEVELEQEVGVELAAPVGIAPIEAWVEMFEPRSFVGRGSWGVLRRRVLSMY